MRVCQCGPIEFTSCVNNRLKAILWAMEKIGSLFLLEEKLLDYQLVRTLEKKPQKEVSVQCTNLFSSEVHRNNNS